MAPVPDAQGLLWQDLHEELVRLSKAGLLELISNDAESFTVRLRKGDPT